MKIKRRHIKMARAAWRVVCSPGAYRNVNRWHRAAKGKHQ